MEPRGSIPVKTGGCCSLPDLISSSHIALVTATVRLMPYPASIPLTLHLTLSQSMQFISRVRKAFFHLLEVTVSLSSRYHPQTNGQTERKIQELGRYLRAYCQKDQHSWSRFLPWAEYAQNFLRQNSTRLTPFQCMLGYQPPLFPWTGEPSEVPAVDHWFRASERAWDLAHIHLQQAVRRHKSFADARRAPAPVYHPGDQAWLSTCASACPAES